MRIAFLHHSFIIGSGIDSLIYQYAKRLRLRGHEVAVCTFRSTYKLPVEGFEVQLVDFPFSGTRLGSGVFAPLFMPWKRLRQELETYDVVVAQLYPANLIPVLPTKLNTKVVCIEWGTPDVFPGILERSYVWVAKEASKIACRRADKVLTPSKFLHQWVLDRYGVSGQIVLLDGIDFDLFDRIKDWGKVRDDNILYVGRISPHKNLETLIKAFELVVSEVPSATLTLVGLQSFPTYFKQLKKLVLDLRLDSKVEFMGVVPWEDLPGYYANCSVYCSPSLWEGFMRCEAYAFGKPIVAFNNTSNWETIQNGVTGWITRKNNNPSYLALDLVRLLENKEEAREMGEEGYRWAKINLDLDVIVENLEEALVGV